VFRDPLELPVLQVLQDHKGKQVHVVIQALKGRLVYKVPLDRKVPLDHKVYRDLV
jgi:hypothetical protein